MWSDGLLIRIIELPNLVKREQSKFKANQKLSENRMNLIVVGLGSMGQRRIRLIQENYPHYSVTGVDSNSARADKVGETYGIRTFSDTESAFKSGEFDAAFISSSPLSHRRIIKKFLSKRLHVFSELNLISDGYLELIGLAEEEKRTLFLSSTMLYRKEIEFIERSLSQVKKKTLYNYHVGQYLPDWHPWENYRDFFVGIKRTNGCREIFAVELPWLIRVFGKIEDLRITAAKLSKLDISFQDSYIVSIVHETGHIGVVVVDVVSRHPIRRLTIVSEDLHLEWDGTPGKIQEYSLSDQTLNTKFMHEEFDDPSLAQENNSR